MDKENLVLTHAHEQSTTLIFLTHPCICTHTTLYSLPTIHTHTTTQTSACTYIHPFHAHAHTHCICNSLHTSTSTHTLLLHYPHPPYPHSHTPSHTCTQTHKLTHTSCTPPYSKMLMTTLSTPLSLISRSVLPTCPSCICHHSLLRSLSSARLITFLLWRL